MRGTIAALAVALGCLAASFASGPNLAHAADARNLAANQGLFFALAENDIPAMAALRDQGANPNATLAESGLKAKDVFDPNLPIFSQPLSVEGWPILTWAVYLNNEPATRLLLRAGASTNFADSHGATPLHWAAWGGRHALARQLLNNSASCQAKDYQGRIPKDWAVMASQTDMIRLLDGRSCRGAADGDEDQDGVPDSLDLCPGTPFGAQVDERGCWVVAYATFFDLDKDIIKREFLPHIQKAAQVLINHPDILVTLVGHCDSSGSDEYNLALGLRRAEAIKRELVAQGVEETRLNVETKGEFEPIADNYSWSGRSKNRRVEIQVTQPGVGAGF
jgi:outer membrane protein OmpA-like peptidoglycan-associated protein